MSFPLPPDTRSIGSGNPPQDMNQVIDALAGLGALRLVKPSGDPTGVTDAALISTLAGGFGGNGGVILLAPATAAAPYYWKAGQIVISQPGITVACPWSGRWGCVVQGVGTGDVFRMYSTANYSGSGGGIAGGGLKGVVIDGTGMGAGSSGVHIGDIYNLEVDFGVRHFQGTGSKGAWLDNNYATNGAEQMTGKIWAETCTTHVQFDVSASTGTPTGSFDRANLNIFLDGKGKGDLVTFANGAFITNGALGIYGNTDYGASLFYCLKLTGSNAGKFSQITNSTLNVGIECNGTSGTQPGTINFASAQNNVITGCTGLIDFSGNNPFALANNPVGSFQFGGPVYGDNTLHSSGQLGMYPFKVSGSGGSGNLANADQITTRYSDLIQVTTSGNVTGIRLQGFPPDNWRVIHLINNGTGTITFDVASTSLVASGVSNVITANSAASFVWNNDISRWFQLP